MLPDHVEVHRAPLVESAYTRKRDWALPPERTRHWSGRASVQPDRSFEVRSPARETAQRRLRVYLPAGATVESADRLLIGGRWYEVDGAPMVWGTGGLRHVRVNAWEVEH
ncbi:hypothetical protein GCM10010218_19730 [Streptomyces mashuensis]|uniref:Head-to-tail stopper n=2 Tax=Streptomyces mashuensis TaxID=33904 RepID=A0A919EC69_9ACTN|nr:hypothetical protein GCM10010218_19730 [Streptomyces mashuensis]